MIPVYLVKGPPEHPTKARCHRRVRSSLIGPVHDLVKLRRLIHQILAELASLEGVPCDFRVQVTREGGEQIVTSTGEAHAYGSQAMELAIEAFQHVYQLAGQCAYICPNSSFSIRASQAIAHGDQEH